MKPAELKTGQTIHRQLNRSELVCRVIVPRGGTIMFRIGSLPFPLIAVLGFDVPLCDAD